MNGQPYHAMGYGNLPMMNLNGNGAYQQTAHRGRNIYQGKGLLTRNRISHEARCETRRERIAYP
jgi:hypothetical protein